MKQILFIVIGFWYSTSIFGQQNPTVVYDTIRRNTVILDTISRISTQANSENVKTIKKIQQFNLNASPLITQFIPFGKRASFSFPYLLQYKRWKGDRILKFAFGINLVPELFELGNPSDPQFINMCIGFHRQKTLSKNWFYIKGFDILFSASNISLSNPATILDDAEGAFLLGPTYTLGYQLNDKFSIWTESSLLFGFSSLGPFKIVGIPPLSLYMGIKI